MGIYQVVGKQTHLGQQMRNVFYYTTTGALTTTLKQELADVFRVKWSTWATAAGLCNDWSLDGIYIRDVASGGIPGVDLTFTSGVLTGPSALDPLPAQVSLLVIGRTGTVKPNQVRTYLTGLNVTMSDADGFFVAATVVDAFDLAVDLDVLALTGETAYRVAASWTLGSNPYVDDTNIMVTYSAKENPATQKRRRIGRGA